MNNQSNMKNRILGLHVITLISLLTVGPSSATVLFSDGFEKGVAEENIKFNEPTTGSYTLNTLQPNSMIVVSGSAEGGPDAAYNGSNYLSLTRSDSLRYYPGLGVMFDGGSISPATQSFSVSFAIWSRSGFASFCLGNNFKLEPSSQLLVNALDSKSGHYRAFEGNSYVTIADIQPNQWNLIEIEWDSQSQEATVSINDELTVTTPLLGTVPSSVDRLLFSSGSDDTKYWIDDVQVEIRP